MNKFILCFVGFTAIVGNTLAYGNPNQYGNSHQYGAHANNAIAYQQQPAVTVHVLSSGHVGYGGGSARYGAGSADYGAGSAGYGGGSARYGAGSADYGAGSPGHGPASAGYGSSANYAAAPLSPAIVQIAAAPANTRNLVHNALSLPAPSIPINALLPAGPNNLVLAPAAGPAVGSYGKAGVARSAAAASHVQRIQAPAPVLSYNYPGSVHSVGVPSQVASGTYGNSAGAVVVAPAASSAY